MILSANAEAGLFPYKMTPDVGYREENLTDIEVREIKRLVINRYPGALVMIGGSTDGCKCEEGPECSSQVIVNGRINDENYDVALSKLGDQWAISKEWAARDNVRELIMRYRETRDESFLARAKDEYESIRSRAKECSEFNKAKQSGTR